VSLLSRLLAFLRLRREADAPAARTAADKPAVIPVLTVGEAPQAPSVPPQAVEIVAQFEGFRAAAYLCPAGVWTIGYGATRGPDGRPVREGDRIDEAGARRLLERDLADAAEAVAGLVRVRLSDNAFSALISFVFNVGRRNFARSTMLTHINAGRMDSAAGEFTRWIFAGDLVLPGLVRRRAAEAALFRAE
jgi:lysozyme